MAEKDLGKREAPGREKNRISISCRHEGRSVTLDFNIHHKIKKVQQDILEEFKRIHNLQPPPNAVPYLMYGNLRLSDLEQSLEGYNIPDGATLDLLFQTGAG